MLAQIKSIIYPRSGQKLPDDDTYAIVKANTEEHGTITLKGPLRRVVSGEWLDIETRFEPGKGKHGPTYTVLAYKQVIPHGTVSASSKAKWLADHIPGIGAKTAATIVETIGLEYVNKNPEVLGDYVSPRYRLAAVEAWNEFNNFINLDTVLETVGIVGKRKEKLIAHYGGSQKTLEQLRRDPWSLSTIGLNFTFPMLDRLAVILGVQLDHPSRIEACAVFELDLLCRSNGNTMQLNNTLIKRIQRVLNVDDMIVDKDKIINAITHNSEIKTLGPSWLTTTTLYDSERAIWHIIQNLEKGQGLGISENMVASVSKQYHLDDQQTAALKMMNGQSICSLTGGPGTGKTTTLGAFVHLARRAGKKLVLIAPTGLAARRLSTVSDHPASTIHRWLGQVDRGLPDEELPDIVVIDECSMLPSSLAATVMKAAYTVAGRIILVGDPYQLPPIEPGSPFKDILDYNIIASTFLEKIWRQAGGSIIPTVARLIREGKRPDATAGVGKQNHGWRYIECETPFDVEREASIESIRQYRSFLEKGGNVTLAPMYQYEGGVERLGAVLQKNLNSKPRQIFKGEKGEWRTGDPCLHVGNDYAKNLTHAMRGTVIDIKNNAKLPLLIISWEDGITRSHPCKDGDGGRIVLGYVLTYHRSQGSEYPGVTVALTRRQLNVANREAIYTAITRAKTEVVLVAEQGVLDEALKTQGSKRITLLSYIFKKHQHDNHLAITEDRH